MRRRRRVTTCLLQLWCYLFCFYAELLLSFLCSLAAAGRYRAAPTRIVDGFYEEGKRAIDACRFLIAKAAVYWRREEGSYRDDITCTVIYLPHAVKALRAAALR